MIDQKKAKESKDVFEEKHSLVICIWMVVYPQESIYSETLRKRIATVTRKKLIKEEIISETVRINDNDIEVITELSYQIAKSTTKNRTPNPVPRKTSNPHRTSTPKLKDLKEQIVFSF